MKTNLFLQKCFEQILENEFEKIQVEDMDDNQLLKCLHTSFLVINTHFNLKIKNSLIIDFLEFIKNTLKNVETFPLFPWNECEGFLKIDDYIQNISKQYLFVYFNQKTVFKNKNNQILPLSDKDYSPFIESEESKIENSHLETIKPIGVFVSESFNDKYDLYTIFENESKQIVCKRLGIQSKASQVSETLSVSDFISEPTKILITTVPNSNSKILFVSNESGVCSVLHLNSTSTFRKYTKKETFYFQKRFEFLLEKPENATIEYIYCRRCEVEGDLILFWGGSYNNYIKDVNLKPWRYYTGINESALKQSDKKLNRIFRAVYEEDIENMTFTKPIFLSNFNKLLDESENVIFEHSYGQVIGDCLTLPHTQDLMILVKSISVHQCTRDTNCDYCSLSWYLNDKSGILGLETVKDVKKIVSISMF
jgi:hypothetical protein